jgi:hypothetical protein
LARYDCEFLKGNPLVLWSNLWYRLVMAVSPANMTQYSPKVAKIALPMQPRRKPVSLVQAKRP